MFYKIYIKATCRLFSQKRPLVSVVSLTLPIPGRGIPRQGKQFLVAIFFYVGYSPPKCTCNGKHTHSSEFMILTRMSTCPIPCLEFSSTPLHMLMLCMKTVSKQNYLFYLWATLRYKYVGQSSEVNLLGNSPKQFMGFSDVNC